MGMGPWMTCCWPGLPRLWWRGQWWGFLVAALFALGLNAALATTFLWPHLIPPSGRGASWAVVAVVWLVCLRRGAGRLSQFYCGDGHHNDELFSRAQDEYLQGRWFEAESQLLRLVRDDPADVEGRLLLATLYRHTQRPELARAQLDQIERFPHARRWRWETLQERSRLKQSRPEPAPSGETSPPESALSTSKDRSNSEDRSASKDRSTSEDRSTGAEKNEITGEANFAGSSERQFAAEQKTATKEDSVARGGLSKAA